MKLLILKPSSLGDVVHALPVARLLKAKFPESRLHWWIDAHLAPLLEGDRDVDVVVPFPRRRWRSPQYWPEAVRSLHEIRRTRFDWVIDLQGLARSGLLAWLANGRLTVGLEDLREGAATFYDIRVPRPSPTAHAVDWYLGALRRLGVPVHWEFEWLPRRAEAAASIRNRWPDDGERWLAVQPGARWSTKRWPPDSFAGLVRCLAQRRPNLRFAVLGSAEDHPLAQVVCQAQPDRCLNLAGQNSLPEMVEWIRRCDLMVSNDTGPMHVAAALGKPVVALFGPTDPRRTGPYGQVERVLQEPLACVPCLKGRCHHVRPLECLRTLAVDSVANAVFSRLPA